MPANDKVMFQVTKDFATWIRKTAKELGLTYRELFADICKVYEQEQKNRKGK